MAQLVPPDVRERMCVKTSELDADRWLSSLKALPDRTNDNENDDDDEDATMIMYLRTKWTDSINGKRYMMMETESGKFHYLYIVLSSYYTQLPIAHRARHRARQVGTSRASPLRACSTACSCWCPPAARRSAPQRPHSIIISTPGASDLKLYLALPAVHTGIIGPITRLGSAKA